MTAIITNKQKQMMADLFFDLLMNPSPTSQLKNLYYFIGRPQPWTDPYNDNNPEPPSPTLDGEFSSHMDILALKKVETGSNIGYVIPRNDWVSGTVYRCYDIDDMQLYEHPSAEDFELAANYISLHPNDPWIPGSFYVMNSMFEVYVCIDNSGVILDVTNFVSGNYPYAVNGRLVHKSTVEPTGGFIAPNYIVETSDGYKWKYVFKVSAGMVDKFATESWIPVKNASSSESESEYVEQYTLQQDAALNANGTILNVVVDLNSSSGDNIPVYWYGSKTQVGIGGPIANEPTNSVTNIVINNSDIPFQTSGLVNQDDIFIGSELTLIYNSGAESGNTYKRTIIDYTIDTTTSSFSILDPLPQTPSSSDFVYVVPRIDIVANTTGLQLTAIVNPTTDKVENIRIESSGQNYKFISLNVYGSNLSQTYNVGNPEPLYLPLRAILSPVTGLGSQPKDELGGWSIMINSEFDNIEGSLNIEETNITNVSVDVAGIGTFDPATFSLLAIGYYLIYNDGVIGNQERRITALDPVTFKATLSEPFVDDAAEYIPLSGVSMLLRKYVGVDFPSDNDYRRIGLIRNVQDNADNYTISPTLRGCKMLFVDDAPDKTELLPGFVPDEIIVQSSSGATCKVIEYQLVKDEDNNPVPDPIHAGKWLATIKYFQDTDTGFIDFVENETITGQTSLKTANVKALVEPEYKPFSGDIIYIEQRRPISRAPRQQEQIKTVIRF